MASVAADTSAIAPPLPLPSRSDAAPPAGPSGAFADLLNARTVPGPQAQGTGPASATPAQDSANPAAPGAVSGRDTAAADPATLVSPKASSGKDAKGSDTAADDPGNGDSAADQTVVAGLVILPLAVASIAVAPAQNPPASGDAQNGSADPVTPVTADSSGKSREADDATPPSSPSTAALAALIPGVPATVDMPGPSAVTSNAAVGSPPTMRAIPAPATAPATATANAPTIATANAPAIANAPPIANAPASATANTPATPTASAPAPAGALDVPPALAVPAQQPDATALSNPPVTAPTPDVVLGFAPAAELSNVVAPALPAMPGAVATPDQSPKSNPPPGIAPAVNAGNSSSFTSVAPINPVLLRTSAAGLVAGGEQTPANPGAMRESDPVLIALPAQVATRFAASIRATDGGAPDLSPDASLTSPASTDGATKGGNDQPGPIQPNFNPAVLTQLQAAPVIAAPPPHAAVNTEAVPLAGIPIAIAARVEAGEKHFEIRLDPPDLGRIEVQLSVDSSGRAISHLVVDRADTLDLLRRDAPALERALHSAGLTTDDGALQFSLRDQSFAGRGQGMPAPPQAPAAPAPTESDVAPMDTAVRRYGAPTGLGSGIDIRV